MEYIERDGTKQKIYNVNINDDVLYNICHHIIKECSYKEKGTFLVEKEYISKTGQIRKYFINGAMEYQNVRLIKNYGSDKTLVKATRIIPPYLVEILTALIKNESKMGNYNTLDEFITYSKGYDLIPIEDRIKSAIDSLNDPTTKKIKELEERYRDILNNLLERKRQDLYFTSEQIESIKYYYDLAARFITLELVRVVDEVPFEPKTFTIGTMIK